MILFGKTRGDSVAAEVAGVTNHLFRRRRREEIVLSASENECRDVLPRTVVARSYCSCCCLRGRDF